MEIGIAISVGLIVLLAVKTAVTVWHFGFVEIARHVKASFQRPAQGTSLAR
jgi:hypothetical protein